ncbi:serine/threonine-protein kinase [Nocardia sp. NPDC051832]|uniref:serine/threonine-protein kinase n=1 Tax=Nocardia sp. NPDC051832 TaxID=3155673 RepID=UPI00341CE5F9
MPETLSPGTVFAGYRICRVLGTGGMGTVYVAEHPRLPRLDALKVLAVQYGAEPAFRARFEREAELVAALEHPNIVAVRDRGVEHGQPWLSMRFVDGIDAGELIRRYPAGVPPAIAVHIIAEVARGLDAAHRAGMLHRDVKPANILLEQRPGLPDRVYLTDFGIARVATDATALTEEGEVLATLAYAAPEQLVAGELDHQTDVYALGCTLYELLTGTKPYPRPSTVAVLHAHLFDPPPSATARNPALPAAIDAVIARALAKERDQRLPTCGALAEAAAAAFAGGADVAAARPVRRKSGRRRVGIGAICLGLSALIAVVVAWNWGRITSIGGPPTTPASAWVDYAFVAETLPALLPSAPIGSGYQGLRCHAVATESMNQAPLKGRTDNLARLKCRGNGAPLQELLVECHADRSPPQMFTVYAAARMGDQRWERAGGRGRLVWSNLNQSGQQPRGVLQIDFDDDARKHCQLTVWGGSNGQELVDRWWPSAPL